MQSHFMELNKTGENVQNIFFKRKKKNFMQSHFMELNKTGAQE